MAHIFESFLKKDWTSIDTVSLVVEKNTKKAINETIAQLDELMKVNHRVVMLDATIVKDEDKIAMLVGYSLYRYRNIDAFHFKAVMVELSPVESVEINDAYRDLFVKLRGQGGGWEHYAAQKGFNWYIINAILNAQIDSMLSRLRAVQEKYAPYIANVPDTLPKLEDIHRRWNFHIRQTNLLQLYKTCFNEVDQILAPASCYNPNPSFQRALVWSEEKKRNFIHSVLDEIPIGAFYVNRSKKYDPYFKLGEGFGGLVWDGKQRLHALHDFILGKFAVLVNGEWMYYHDHPAYFTHRFNDCSITEYESNFDTLREIIEAYVVINSAQVKHTDEDLQKAIDFLEKQGQLS